MTIKTRAKKQVSIAKYHIINILEISLFISIYFLMGFFTSYGINLIYPPFSKEEGKSKILLFLEIIGQLAFIGVIIYILRSIMKKIIDPYLKFFGNKQSHVIDLYENISLSYGVFTAQNNLNDKIKYLIEN